MATLFKIAFFCKPYIYYNMASLHSCILVDVVVAGRLALANVAIAVVGVLLLFPGMRLGVLYNTTTTLKTTYVVDDSAVVLVIIGIRCCCCCGGVRSSVLRRFCRQIHLKRSNCCCY